MKHLSNGSLLFPLELSTSWWMGMDRGYAGYASASTWHYEIIFVLYLVRKNRNDHLSLYHGDDKHIVYHTNTIVYSTGLHKK